MTSEFMDMPQLESYTKKVRNDECAEISITVKHDWSYGVSVRNGDYGESFGLKNIGELTAFFIGLEYGQRESWEPFRTVYDTEAWKKAHDKWAQKQVK